MGETLEQAVAREVMEAELKLKLALRDLPTVAVSSVVNDRVYGGI